MSFGTAANDIFAVVALCKALHRKCRDAGQDYEEISREVRALHTVLRHLRYEVEAEDSILNHDPSLWIRQLGPLIGSCDLTLHELEKLLQRYSRLSTGNSIPNSIAAQRNQVHSGSNEMDALGVIRAGLISHKKNMTRFLDTLQLHQPEETLPELDNHSGQLDNILDKVDIIAARMGQGNCRIMATTEDDNKEVWKQFRKELVNEGFARDILEQHKDVLRAYIREIDQKGLLDTGPPAQNSTTHGSPNSERWLEDAQARNPVNTLLPTFSSLNFASDDTGAKELMVQEDNMKFPQSIKLTRPKPDSREDGQTYSVTDAPYLSPDNKPDLTVSQPPRTAAVPRLITAQPLDINGKEIATRKQSSISDADLEPTAQLMTSLGTLIRTSDLLASPHTISLQPYSPSSFQSQASFGGSYTDFEQASNWKPLTNKLIGAVDNGNAPLSAAPVPIPIPNPANPRSSAASLRPETSNFKLAPDSQGNPIPSDAHWTKINRRLVSPQILDQDKRRYEARPDFVAVLGILSRGEIENLAARSHEIREARRKRAASTMQTKPSIAAQAIPQPSNAVLGTSPGNGRRKVRFGRETPSSSTSDTSSSSDSDSSDSDQGKHRRRHRSRRRETGETNSNVGVPVSGYPNPYGSPPSPARSPGYTWTSSGKDKGDRYRDRDRNRDRDRDDRPRDREDQSRVDQNRDSYRDGRRDHSRRHHSHHHSRSHHHSSHSSGGGGASNKSRAPATEKEKRSSRWKENLTAAGIGGAAVSLLSVLSEAAEGM